MPEFFLAPFIFYFYAEAEKKEMEIKIWCQYKSESAYFQAFLVIKLLASFLGSDGGLAEKKKRKQPKRVSLELHWILRYFSINLF